MLISAFEKNIASFLSKGIILLKLSFLEDKVLNSEKVLLFLFLFSGLFSLFQIPVLLSNEQLRNNNKKKNIKK